MSEAQQFLTKEVISWEEIRRRYPEQHVLLVGYTHDTTQPHPESAIVVASSKSRKELWRVATEKLANTPCGVFFTGVYRGSFPGLFR